MIGLSRQTAGRLKLLLGEQEGGRGNSIRGPGERWVYVRCTDATAAGGSGVDAQCYPGVIVNPASVATEQEELGLVWLTLLEGTSVGVPAADIVYVGVMTGFHSIGGDERPRVFASQNTVTLMASDCTPVLVSAREIFTTAPSPPSPPATPTITATLTGRAEPSGPYPEGTLVNFQVSGITGGTGPYDVDIEFGDGDSDSDTGVSSEAYFAHAYPDAGLYYPRVTITDSGTETSGPIGVSNGDGTRHYNIVADPGGVRRPTTYVLDAAFAAAADATLNDITGTDVDLIFALAPGVYQFAGELYCNTDATGGAKVAMVFGGSLSSILYELRAQNLTSRAFVMASRQTASGSSDSFNTPTVATVYVSGTITVTAAGNLSVQFSQESASGTSTVLAGSWFTVSPSAVR